MTYVVQDNEKERQHTVNGDSGPQRDNDNKCNTETEVYRRYYVVIFHLQSLFHLTIFLFPPLTLSLCFGFFKLSLM